MWSPWLLREMDYKEARRTEARSHKWDRKGTNRDAHEDQREELLGSKAGEVSSTVEGQGALGA